MFSSSSQTLPRGFLIATSALITKCGGLGISLFLFFSLWLPSQVSCACLFSVNEQNFVSCKTEHNWKVEAVEIIMPHLDSTDELLVKSLQWSIPESLLQPVTFSMCPTVVWESETLTFFHLLKVLFCSQAADTTAIRAQLCYIFRHQTFFCT